jgi:hypothetical protein
VPGFGDAAHEAAAEPVEEARQYSFVAGWFRVGCLEPQSHRGTEGFTEVTTIASCSGYSAPLAKRAPPRRKPVGAKISRKLPVSMRSPLGCHPREGGGPGHETERSAWIPAFAGMTMKERLVKSNSYPSAHGRKPGPITADFSEFSTCGGFGAQLAPPAFMDTGFRRYDTWGSSSGDGAQHIGLQRRCSVNPLCLCGSVVQGDTYDLSA